VPRYRRGGRPSCPLPHCPAGPPPAARPARSTTVPEPDDPRFDGVEHAAEPVPLLGEDVDLGPTDLGDKDCGGAVEAEAAVYRDSLRVLPAKAIGGTNR